MFFLSNTTTRLAGKSGGAPELRPVECAEQIARFLVDRASAVPDVTFLERTVNGQPGLVAQLDGEYDIPGVPGN